MLEKKPNRSVEKGISNFPSYVECGGSMVKRQGYLGFKEFIVAMQVERFMFASPNFKCACLKLLFLWLKLDMRYLMKFFIATVKRDFICLSICNELCHPFTSLEAVRKHMESKSHCKVHYGDGGDEEDAKLEEFYDESTWRTK
ncbi:hypothetical protein Bca101_013421 [Brassica carinata]